METPPSEVTTPELDQSPVGAIVGFAALLLLEPLLALIYRRERAAS
jgi:hypothetical protein